MTMKLRLDKLVTEKNGIITVEECLKNNITSAFLARMVKLNKLERIARGIYSLPSADYDEYYIFHLVNKRSVFSHTTALYLLELIDRIPFNIEITLPHQYNASHIDKEIIIYKVVNKYYDIGIIEVKTIYGNTVRCYNKERTIIDIVRKKGNMDIEIYAKAIQNFFKSKDRNYHKLREYALIFKVEKEINSLLEVMG